MDNPDYEDLDEKLDADELATRADWLTLDRVGELLGMTEEEVLAACQSGAIDSQWNFYEDGSRRYYVFFKEVDSYRANGPRQHMTFDEAMRLLEEGRVVRRPCWNREYLAVSIYSTDKETIYCQWWYYGGHDPAYWWGEPYTENEPWCPTEEDKAATDWVEHEVVYRR